MKETAELLSGGLLVVGRPSARTGDGAALLNGVASLWGVLGAPLSRAL